MATTLIIETSANQLYRVEETNNPDLAHVWYGWAVKRSGGTFIDKKSAHQELVRKAGSRVVARIEDVDAVIFNTADELVCHFGLGRDEMSDLIKFVMMG